MHRTDVVKVFPQPGLPSLTMRVPGDKSISHRAAILGAMAAGETVLEGYLNSADCLATLKALSQLGVKIERQGERVRIASSGVAGWQEPDDILDLGNSGTGLRLLAAAVCRVPGVSILTGDASLRRRPMGRIVRPLQDMGAKISGRRQGELAPLVVDGNGASLRGREFKLAVASAQVKTALLLAGLSADGWTVVEEPALSRDHTERLFRYLGVEMRQEAGRGRVAVAGGQRLRSFHLRIPGDISSAAFFLSAYAPVPGAEIVVEKVGVNPTRTGILQVLQRMGARVEVANLVEEGGEPRADIRLVGGNLKATEIGGAEIPLLIDELPVLSVVATQARGVTVIKDAAELRVKESDRIEVLADCLGRLGVKVEKTPDGLIIPGPQRIRSGEVDSRGDHRIAMAMATAALWAEGPVSIEGAGWVDTSYPGFFSTLARVTRVEQEERRA
ncbi:MAG: 3-phosphoshikimate 1-carboxyvinyltransferase [Limnochordales bacterium]|nr:3-phosphoshikimate 1-carboxyvinyltransferase [Limnochordales bacterium]